MKKILLCLAIALPLLTSAQRILEESVSFYDIIKPKESLDSSIKTYDVRVNIPYTMTAEDAKAQSLQDFEEEKANYQSLVEKSKAEHEEKLKNLCIDDGSGNIFKGGNTWLKELDELEKVIDDGVKLGWSYGKDVARFR